MMNKKKRKHRKRDFMLCLIYLSGRCNFKFLNLKKITFVDKKSGVKLKRRECVTIPPFNCPEIEVQKTSSGWKPFGKVKFA